MSGVRTSTGTRMGFVCGWVCTVCGLSTFVYVHLCVYQSPSTFVCGWERKGKDRVGREAISWLVMVVSTQGGKMGEIIETIERPLRRTEEAGYKVLK